MPECPTDLVQEAMIYKKDQGLLNGIVDSFIE